TVGDYISDSGSTYAVELDGHSTLDVDLIHTIVEPHTSSGTATLNGGTVVVSSTDGTFLIDLPYTIVTADGGRTGVYDNATQNINQFLVPTLSYDPNHVFLTLNTNFAGFANTGNQRAVAEQLDSIRNPSECLEEVLLGLASLTDPEEFNNALDQLSGQQFTSI